MCEDRYLKHTENRRRCQRGGRESDCRVGWRSGKDVEVTLPFCLRSRVTFPAREKLSGRSRPSGSARARKEGAWTGAREGDGNECGWRTGDEFRGGEEGKESPFCQGWHIRACVQTWFPSLHLNGLPSDRPGGSYRNKLGMSDTPSPRCC